MDRGQHQHELQPHTRTARFGRSRRNSIHMTLVFDAYCPWSYAVGPVVQRFLDQHRRVSIEIIHGSVHAHERIMPIGQIEWLPATVASVAGLTGAEFGDGYRQVTERGTFVMDSGAAAIGFIALRSIAPDLALPLANAMQRAFFRDGRSLSDARTYAAIADEHHISVGRLNERLNDRAVRRIARQEAARALDLDVGTYPALLLHVHGGVATIATRLRSPEQLAAALGEHEHVANGRLITHG
jgi:putative protein-disulfide isomerase